MRRENGGEFFESSEVSTDVSFPRVKKYIVKRFGRNCVKRYVEWINDRFVEKFRCDAPCGIGRLIGSRFGETALEQHRFSGKSTVDAQNDFGRVDRGRGFLNDEHFTVGRIERL